MGEVKVGDIRKTRRKIKRVEGRRKERCKAGR